MNCMDGLLWTPTSEGEPAIERSRTLFTTAARSDADGGRDPLHHVAESNVLIGNKSGKAHAIRLTLRFLHLIISCLSLVHRFHLLSWVVTIN